MSGAPQRLLLVDGHAYAYRAFYAIRRLSSPEGSATNAVYGFIKMLSKMHASVQPTHTAVVWDGGLSAERMEALPGYKAQRPPMPDDLEHQVGQIEAYLGAAGIRSLCQGGIEADDWIAAAACVAAKRGFRVVIASSDKDFMQLVSSSVGLLNPNDKSGKIWTPEDVRSRAGVAPDQIVDWLALVGDSVDNIPGVPGVGVKTAAGLLQQFGSIENLYARIEDVAPVRVREALRTAADIVKRNQTLVRLRADIPVECVVDEWQPRSPDLDELKRLYRRWGFNSMLKELESRRPAHAQERLF